MTNPPETSTSAEPTLVGEYDRLWNEAVTTLTAAVRLTHPNDGAIDFADFLARALASVAGNVGSIWRVTAGRPGSWESDLLNQLLEGSLGDDPDDLLAARTEPVIVQLNVSQLVTDAQYEGSAAEERAQKLPVFETALDALGSEVLGDDPTEEQEQAFDIAAADLRRRYTKAYETYAQRFTTAVRDAAADLSALRVPIEVSATTDPDASWWQPEDIKNPDEWLDEDQGDDELAKQLWATARANVGLPTLEDPSED